MNEKRTEAEEAWKETYGDYPDEDDINWYWFRRGWKGGECIYHKDQRHKDTTLFEAMDDYDE